jgi:DNA end-binding protein Ku
MKALWQGTISFGMVSIPVKLYKAVEQHSIGFKMLCKKCMTPVKYKKVCPGCKEDVSMSDLIRGLEIGRDEYLTFTDDELKKLKPEKSDRIEIAEFTDEDEIDVLYYDTPYYAGPAKARDRSYFLFKEVLKTSGKVASGKIVMREKEHVCAIRPYQKGLLLSTLNYKYEVRSMDTIKELEDPPELKKPEIELAIKLVNQLYEEDFDISIFKDTFAEQLREELENREKGKAPKKKKKAKEPEEETPLLEALKASLK